jgi:hypothetical protein
MLFGEAHYIPFFDKNKRSISGKKLSLSQGSGMRICLALCEYF